MVLFWARIVDSDRSSSEYAEALDRFPPSLGGMGKIEVVSTSIGWNSPNMLRSSTLSAESDRSLVGLAHIQHPQMRRKLELNRFVARYIAHAPIQCHSRATRPHVAEDAPEFGNTWPGCGRNEANFWNPSRLNPANPDRHQLDVCQTQSNLGRTQPTLVDRGADLANPQLVKSNPNLVETQDIVVETSPGLAETQAAFVEMWHIVVDRDSEFAGPTARPWCICGTFSRARENARSEVWSGRSFGNARDILQSVPTSARGVSLRLSLELGSVIDRPSIRLGGLFLNVSEFLVG